MVTFPRDSPTGIGNLYPFLLILSPCIALDHLSPSKQTCRMPLGTRPAKRLEPGAWQFNPETSNRAWATRCGAEMVKFTLWVAEPLGCDRWGHATLPKQKTYTYKRGFVYNKRYVCIYYVNESIHILTISTYKYLMYTYIYIYIMTTIMYVYVVYMYTYIKWQ